MVLDWIRLIKICVLSSGLLKISRELGFLGRVMKS
jgi:hypothetical protein